MLRTGFIPSRRGFLAGALQREERHREAVELDVSLLSTAWWAGGASVTGGIGSARDGKSFFVELIKDINAAKAARPQERPQFLRDEMREHHRLREIGALSEEDYEASKARILRAHA